MSRRRVDRGLTVSAGGVTVLVDHHWPASSTEEVIGGVVWIRTPYGRTGMNPIARRFTAAGMHVLVEAIRGTDGSGGGFDGVSFAPSDGLAVAAWLRAQPWFGGTIVTWGLSAIGHACWALAAVDIPEWRLAVLQDTPSDLREVIYPGGAFAGATCLSMVHSVEWQARHPRASLARSLLASVRGARRARRALAALPLGEADRRLVGHRVGYFQQWLDHEHDADFWHRSNLRAHARAMPEQVHLASGWYDMCLAGTLADYAALRAEGRAPRLVIGPWYHGRGSIERPYLAEVTAAVRAALSGDAAAVRPSVRVHVGGVGEWRELPDWPPAGYEPTCWHLHPGGRLDRAPVPRSAPDRYRYDPADPTPAVGGAMENLDGRAGAKDNRRLERRPDVLTYTSDVLTDDLEVIGPVTATIALRSSLVHTDLVVRVCDVEPAGRSVNLCDGARRLGADGPTSAPDGARTVEVDLVAVAHRFRAGHRIRVQVSSGAHPRLVRNTGTGQPLASATALRAADQEILHDPAHRSVLRLPCAQVPDTGNPSGA